MGSDQAVALQERLNTDLGWMPGADPAPGYTVAEWNERVAHEADLDASIVTQVLSPTSPPLADEHGLVERTTVSRVDGLLTTYALYVPANVGPNPPLVVLLHGNPQTETNILGARFFRDLADQNGAIVVAPYGRGIYNFAPPGGDDVYQITDEVSAAFHVASNRVYLVGYSMGGFSVFKIGPKHPERWIAVMAIAGAAYGSEIDSIRDAFLHKPVYVVTGTADESIPTAYPQNTAVYLSRAGVATGLYIQPSGTHYIPTIMPMITQAWQDMMAGKIRSSAMPRGITGVTQMPMNQFDIPPGMRP
jgi:S-formylglutathione hydrolase FrmB